jgi:very-short-patch-repair endonuclease
MARDMHFGAGLELFVWARELRKRMTPAEKLLWNKLKNGIYGYKFRRQHPILFFVADFYCHPARLVIEIDGGYHNAKEQHDYDEGRSHELQSLGIKVIRFSNSEVLSNSKKVINAIKDILRQK